MMSKGLGSDEAVSTLMTHPNLFLSEVSILTKWTTVFLLLMMGTELQKELEVIPSVDSTLIPEKMIIFLSSWGLFLTLMERSSYYDSTRWNETVGILLFLLLGRIVKMESSLRLNIFANLSNFLAVDYFSQIQAILAWVWRSLQYFMQFY